VPAQAQAGGEVSEQQQILRVETGGSGLAAVAAVDTVHAIVAPEDGTAGAAIADVVHGAPEREGARAVEAGLLLREVAGDPGVETGEGRALQESLGVFDLPDRRPAAEAGAAVAERLRRVPVPDPRRQRVGVAGVAVEGQRTGPQRTVAALQPRRRGPDPGLALAQRPASLHAAVGGVVARERTDGGAPFVAAAPGDQVDRQTAPSDPGVVAARRDVDLLQGAEVDRGERAARGPVGE